MSLPCGHTAAQHWSDGRCGSCRSVNYDHLSYRLRILPEQLERARLKVAALENEARRYGMTELLGSKAA